MSPSEGRTSQITLCYYILHLVDPSWPLEHIFDVVDRLYLPNQMSLVEISQVSHSCSSIPRVQGVKFSKEFHHPGSNAGVTTNDFIGRKVSLYNTKSTPQISLKARYFYLPAIF